MYFTEINASGYDEWYSFKFYFNDELDDEEFLELVKNWIIDTNKTLFTEIFNINNISEKTIIKTMFTSSEYVNLNNIKKDELILFIKKMEKDDPQFICDFIDLPIDINHLQKDEVLSDLKSHLRFSDYSYDMISKYLTIECCVTFEDWLEDNLYGNKEEKSDIQLNFSLK